MKTTVKLHFGAFAESFEKQLNAQGFTLKGNSVKFEKANDAITQLMFSNILTDSQVCKCQEKLSKQICKQATQLEDK